MEKISGASDYEVTSVDAALAEENPHADSIVLRTMPQVGSFGVLIEPFDVPNRPCDLAWRLFLTPIRRRLVQMVRIWCGIQQPCSELLVNSLN